MANQGFRNRNLITPYVYQDNGTSSLAIGIDGNDSNKIKISTSASTDARVTTSNQFEIDPSANGNITINPNGTGTLNVAYGTQFLLPIFGASGAVQNLADGIGSSGTILMSNGAGSEPTWQAVASSGAVIDFLPDSGTTPVVPDGTGSITITGGTTGLTFVGGLNSLTQSGTLVVANGGTGATSLTDHGVLLGSGTAAVSVTAVGTDGQVLIGATGADPAFATLTSTDGSISFTPGVNSLDLEANGTIMWTVVTGTSQTLAAGNGYFANNGVQVDFSLPVSAAVGDTFAVAGMNNATGWTITQNAGQTIHFGTSDTTTGVGGSLTSTATYDTVHLVCNVANTEFVVINSIGNITVV